MNHMNEILRAANNKALDALTFLDAIGATAVGIDVRGGRPLIRLDGAPPGRFVQGAIRKTHMVGQRREHVMVALVHGCQVEWIVRTIPARWATPREIA